MNPEITRRRFLARSALTAGGVATVPSGCNAGTSGSSANGDSGATVTLTVMYTNNELTKEHIAGFEKPTRASGSSSSRPTPPGSTTGTTEGRKKIVRHSPTAFSRRFSSTASPSAPATLSWTWGDYIAPALLPDVDHTTLSVAITSWYRDPRGSAIPTVQAAGAALYMIPVLLIFLFAQRYFIRSVVTSGIKG
ncbi:hypothetical protein ABZS29_21315 [Kribbella sp. NPDC005582]|uniref:hypothetical protein n=1 Tax=Kribbella sp. NPDC005582 TaxID=3156893 RepID=UPI0033B3F696